MSTQQQETLKAELKPEAVQKRRRPALGRGLGALLMRGQLATAARKVPLMQVPTWASGLEPEQKAWIKKVLLKAQSRSHKAKV